MTKASEKTVFHVSSRDMKGSNNVSRLRREGKIPGNIYGLGKDSVSILADYQGAKKLYESQGDTGLIYLQVNEDKKQIPVLIDEVAYTKLGHNLLHIVFKRVNLNVKVEAEVPVVMVGEAKIDNAIVSLVKDSVLIEALPADLLENFEVDVSSLTEIGQSITLADLTYDNSKISLVLGEDEKPSDIMLINVQAVKEEVEETQEPTEESQVAEGNDQASASETNDSGENKKEENN